MDYISKCKDYCTKANKFAKYAGILYIINTVCVILLCLVSVIAGGISYLIAYGLGVLLSAMFSFYFFSLAKQGDKFSDSGDMQKLKANGQQKFFSGLALCLYAINSLIQGISSVSGILGIISILIALVQIGILGALSVYGQRQYENARDYLKQGSLDANMNQGYNNTYTTITPNHVSTTLYDNTRTRNKSVNMHKEFTIGKKNNQQQNQQPQYQQQSYQQNPQQQYQQQGYQQNYSQQQYQQVNQQNYSQQGYQQTGQQYQQVNNQQAYQQQYQQIPTQQGYRQQNYNQQYQQDDNIKLW
jgi:hypothetical protein